MKKFIVGLLTILMIGLLITAPGFTYRVEAFSEEELQAIDNIINKPELSF